MEKFIKAVAIAWNPIDEVRRRMQFGTLAMGSALVHFIDIVIACNLFGVGAQKFYWESALHAAGGKLPNHPLMSSDYAQRLLSIIRVLVPATAVALLSARAFDPPDRSATLAAC